MLYQIGTCEEQQGVELFLLNALFPTQNLYTRHRGRASQSPLGAPQSHTIADDIHMSGSL
ncbi:MAG: hypothetical protein ACI97A_003996 [Planctomycetota bacterium]|jgi:hypothetical protein